MNMISFLNTSDRTAWTQTGPEKPFGFSGPVPCLCNTNIPAIDYFLIRPWQTLRLIFVVYASAFSSAAARLAASSSSSLR